MNLFNLLPTVPQETRNLYFEAGMSAEEFSRIGVADAPYIESFEEMMARIREETNQESSAPERDVFPGAEPAEPNNGRDSPDYREYNAEKPIRADDQKAPAKDPRVEGNESGDKKRSGEEVVVGDLSGGMVRPDGMVSQTAVEDIPDAAITEGEEAGGITAGDIAASGVKADPAFSPEDGILFTDTYPLFDNKPDVRGIGVDTPVDVDTVPVPGLAQDARVMLAQVTDGDIAPDAVTKDRGAKDGLKDIVSEEIPELHIPSELSNGSHQLVALAHNAENEAKPENAAGKKKADSRKLTVEVVDMRSDSGTNVRDGEAKTAALPVKDISVDLKDAVLGSLGDAGSSRQTPVGFDQFSQFNNTGAKNAAQLESFLSRELHNGLNGDIVRQAAVMLRDGGEGLIRLQLHPESLGNVRIKLALSGNKVEGIITVESPEAMNAFERELESLEMAFRDSGFEGASLNMQMSGGKTGNGLFDGVQAGAFSQVIAASSYESSTVTAGEGVRSIYDHGGLSILA
jgi:hypothetical protein